ncbi:MAG: hypothetical protein JWO87_2736, partial [Phycisphaerales bacterium]|nr:hypothetical protein [Phycisphaerales bacterium]
HAFALLRNGSRGGWTGNGVTSSDAAATGTGVGAAALGVALNDPAGAAVHFTRFDGVEVGDSDVLVKYTLAGDADLSGNVNDADYQILSAHYAQTGASWAAGDFTFDTQIRGDDYQRLSDNMGQELTGPLAPHDIAAFAVPIHAVEAQPYSGAVVQFYDSLNTPGNPAPTTASSYQAFISWGDGNFLPAKVSDDGLGDGGFVAAATAPFVLRNPDALISTRVEYSQSSRLQGLPPTLATPQLSIIPAVAGLLAFTASTSEIDLRWTLNATNASAIEVDRSLDGITFAPLTTLSGTATTYQDTAAGIGQHYFYEVRAIQPAGPSPFSNVTDGYAVSAISDLTAVAASNSEIDLSWASNTSDATKFEIDRSTDGANYTLLATTTDTTFNNTGLPEGTHYWYQVRAIRPGGLSAPCIPADTYTFPNSPTLVAVSAGTGNGAEADLRWINGSSKSPGFNIERSQDGSFWEGADSTDPGVTTDSDLGVADGTHYSYRVRAYNEGGESDPSNVLDVFIPLTPPSLLVASAASASQINLTWENDSLSATGFSLQRSTDGKTYEQIATIGDPNTTTFSDAGLSPNMRYYYRIAATTASLTSATSEVASGATLS